MYSLNEVLRWTCETSSGARVRRTLRRRWRRGSRIVETETLRVTERKTVDGSLWIDTRRQIEGPTADQT
jgi:hypothetical protein